MTDTTGADAQPKEYRQHRFRRPPGACELLLVRHGESAPTRDDVHHPVVDGHSDPPLDPVGVAQAERVAERLVASGEQIAAIYVTTLQRTVQTAAPLASRLGMGVRVEPEMREVYLGEWEATFRKHMADGHPIGERVMAEGRWDVIPGAEPGEAFAARVRGAVTRLAAAHLDETIVVVTHGGVIGQVLALASGSKPFVFVGADNASISHLVVHGDRWILRRYNDTAHLGTAYTTEPEPLA